MAENNHIEIISREQAIEKGLKKYFTGEPCKYGHVAERFISAKRCVQCLSEYNKRKEYVDFKRNLYLKNKDVIAKDQKNYYLSRCDYIKKRSRNYYKANKEKHSKSGEKWRANNWTKVLMMSRGYCHKRRALLANAKGAFTSKDIEKLLYKQKNRCLSCNKKLKIYHIDHIQPLSKGGTNWPLNLQLLCPSCNCSKQAKDPIDWARENGRLL